MKIVATFQPTTSVVDSLKCQLDPEGNLEHLVVAKLDRIDVFAILPEGLKHQCSIDILGRVLHVRAVPINADSGLSTLVVMTDAPDPELLFYRYTGAALEETKKLSLFEHNQREAEECLDVLVDPSGDFLVVSCYTGKVKIVSLDEGSYESDFDATMPELFVMAMCIINSTSGQPALVLLYVDAQQTLQLVARNIDIDQLDLSSAPSTLFPPTLLSDRYFPEHEHLSLIPVLPSHVSSTGGVLIVGGRKILYLELVTTESQSKLQRKLERTQKKKAAGEAKNATAEAKEAAKKAKAKEKERELRKRKHRAIVDWPWSSVTAWCVPEEGSQRYVLGDSFGRLAILSLASLPEEGLVIIPLGEASPPTTLTHLSSGIFYLGSHSGDSHLIRVSPQAVDKRELPTLPIPTEIPTFSALKAKGKGKAINQDAPGDDGPNQGTVLKTDGSRVTILETFKNLAPIVDAALVDLDGSGQRQIVTCSGGNGAGSLNVIRNGAQYEERASYEGITGIVNIWNLRDTFETITDSLVAISTLQKTHIFTLDGQELRLTGGYVTDEPTLFLGNVKNRSFVTKAGKRGSVYQDSSLVVQVTPKRVVMLEWIPLSDGFNQVGEWTPPRGAGAIVAASASPSQVVVAASGAELFVLNWSVESKASEYFTQILKVQVGDADNAVNEISAVSCLPWEVEDYSLAVVVSLWATNTVSIYRISEFTVANRENRSPIALATTPTLPALPRSLMIRKMHDTRHTHLFVGLTNGTVVSYKFSGFKHDRQAITHWDLSEQKAFALGDAPVNLACINSNGQPAVLASGSRASVFFWDKESLRQSSIMLKDVVSATPFNTPKQEEEQEGKQQEIVIATATGLSIGSVKDLHKMHIRSIPLGLDTPRYVRYHPKRKVFGVACKRTEPCRVGDTATNRSSFRLLDDVTFNHLSQFNCPGDEEISTVHTFPVGKQTYFCVGTVAYEAHEAEPTTGRLLVFSTEANGAVGLTLVGSKQLGGCPYAMTTIGDFLAIAVNSSVALFSVTRKSPEIPDMTIELLNTWCHNYIVATLTSHGSHLMLGDAIASVSLVRLESSIPKLVTVARDYGPLWPNAIEALDEEHIIGSNADCNLFTFELQKNGTKKGLSRDGSYYMGDMINKFLSGSLLAPDAIEKGAPLQPEQLLVTSSGRISVVIDVEKDMAMNLSLLQRNMAGVLSPSHNKFRSPKNVRGRSDADVSAFGFLDGDFLESYLALPLDSDVRQRIAKGQSDAEALEQSDEEIKKALETLQSLH